MSSEWVCNDKSSDILNPKYGVGMNIKPFIKEELWTDVDMSFNAGNYRASILDAFQHLTEIVRERSGEDGDGCDLIAKAFGGKSPKIKINRYQTRSEKDAQDGLQHLLRGLYMYARNPRTHEKEKDEEQTAISIIMFIDLLGGQIEKGKGPFVLSDFLDKVFDVDFPNDKAYCKLNVSEIPSKYRYEVFVQVFRRKEEGDGRKLKILIAELTKLLNEEEISSVIDMISEELSNIRDTKSFILILQIFPPDYWKMYSKTSKLWAENIIHNSIKSGKYNLKNSMFIDGSLGAWSTNIVKYMEKKNDLLSLLLGKLRSDDTNKSDYVFNYWFHLLPELESPPNPWMINIIKKGLSNGDQRYYDELHNLGSDFLDEEWNKEWLNGWGAPFKDLLLSFKPNVNDADEDIEDDLPF